QHDVGAGAEHAQVVEDGQLHDQKGQQNQRHFRARVAHGVSDLGCQISTLTKSRRLRSTRGSIDTSCWSEPGCTLAERTLPTGMPGGNTLPCRPLVTTTSSPVTLVPTSTRSTGSGCRTPLPRATPTSPDPDIRMPTLKAGSVTS